jgi:hypothetical protein
LLWWFFDFYRPSEPHDGGKCLSHWARDVIATDPDGSCSSPEIKLRNQRAEAAIRAIGTNSLPLAMAFYHARDGKFKDWIVKCSEGISDFLSVDVHIAPEEEKWAEGDGSLYALGPDAKAAIPSLLAILQGRDAYIAQHAMDGFGIIGPASIPPLIDVLTNGDAPGRYNAAQCLGSFRGQASNAVPALLSSLKSKDPFLRGVAAESLATISHDPVTVVPALVNYLETETNKTIFNNFGAVISRLGRAGTNASAAVPILTRFAELNEYGAVDALRQIDPERAAAAFRKFRVSQPRDLRASP